jgi:hypothetical protein
LVEQMTLNHRVPGSSPGAPTSPFNDLSCKYDKLAGFRVRLG